MLLSSVLADETSTAWALATKLGVKSKAFYVVRNGVLWDAIDALRKAGQPIVDQAVVCEHLLHFGKLEAAGGYAGVAEATGRTAAMRSLRARIASSRLRSTTRTVTTWAPVSCFTTASPSM